MIYSFNCLILDITDDELNIVRNVWNMLLINVKVVFLTKIEHFRIALFKRMSGVFFRQLIGWTDMTSDLRHKEKDRRQER